MLSSNYPNYNIPYIYMSFIELINFKDFKFVKILNLLYYKKIH